MHILQIILFLSDISREENQYYTPDDGFNALFQKYITKHNGSKTYFFIIIRIKRIWQKNQGII